MSTDTKAAPMTAARLAEIREAFAAHDNGEAEVDAQSLADFIRDLLAHLDALTAPAADGGEALGRMLRDAVLARQMCSRVTPWEDISPEMRRTWTVDAATIYARGVAAGEAERARLAAELAEEQDAHRVASRALFSHAEEIARLTAELAEARAAVESFQRGSGCIDGYTIGEALAKIGASLDRTPTEGIPDAIARLKRAAETARREGARDEREACIADMRGECDDEADHEFMIRAAERIIRRAHAAAAPVEGEDGAT